MYLKLTWREFAELRMKRKFSAHALTPSLYLCIDDDAESILKKFFIIRVKRSPFAGSDNSPEST